MSRWDAAARSVPPPLDPRQRQVVEKLAEFRARNGEAFVDVVRSKQSGNPLYAFLDAGREDDPVAKYYLQCVEARGSGPAEATVGPSGRGFAPNPPISTGTNAGVASFVSNDDFPAGLIPSLAPAGGADADIANDPSLAFLAEVERAGELEAHHNMPDSWLASRGLAMGDFERKVHRYKYRLHARRGHLH